MKRLIFLLGLCVWLIGGIASAYGPEIMLFGNSQWYGPTWTFSGGAWKNTPIPGSNLISNPNFEGNTYSPWTAYGASTLTVNSTTPIDGSYDLKIDVTGSSQGIKYLYTQVAGAWYACGFTYRISPDTLGIDTTTSSISFWPYSYGTSTTNQPYLITGRGAAGSSQYLYVKNAYANSGTFYVDDIFLKQLTLSQLFLSTIKSIPNETVSANITKPGGNLGGIQSGEVLNADSQINPNNFIISYLDGLGNCRLDKNVGGTYTNIGNVACTYGAGYTLSTQSSLSAGTLTVTVTYNGSQKIQTTVTDAGIINNTIFGLFSTNSSDSFASVSVTP